MFIIKSDIFNSSTSPEINAGSKSVRISPSGSSIKGSKSKLNTLSIQPSEQSSLMV